MRFLHYDFHLGLGNVVEVTLDRQANVRLLDDANYTLYKQGRRHLCYGGLAKVSPVRLQVPHAGHWHIAIDLGGHAGKVQASVRVISG
jgi:DNA-binding helix-hairpin-helix protein with protein kinase domain